MSEKVCTFCGEMKPYDAYQRNSHHKTGRSPRCKSCISQVNRTRYYADHEASLAKHRANYAEHKTRILESNARSRERHKDSVKLRKLAEYERNKADPQWLATQKEYRRKNAEAKADYDRRYRSENREKYRQQKRNYVSKNPAITRAIRASYKARRRTSENAGCTTRLVGLWLETKTLVCGWCLSDCSDDFHIDHIQPLARGGLHEITNLTIACPDCNMSKKAKDPFLFALEQALDEVLVRRKLAA